MAISIAPKAAAYLNAVYGINLSAALLWAVAATAPAFISQPVGGFLSDRSGHVRAIIGALLMTAITSAGFVVLAVLGKAVTWQFVLALALVFAFFANMWVLAWRFTTMMFPTSAGGPIGGFMNTFAQLVGAAARVVSGYFIGKTGSYVMVFVIGDRCAFAGFIAALFLKERRVV